MPTPPNATISATKAKWQLVLLGSVLILLFLGGAAYSLGVGSKKKVVRNPGRETTTSRDVPSGSLLEALLATGATLIVLGLFYGRITVIKLPGGSELDLSPVEKNAVAATVKKEVVAGKVPPEAAPAVTVAAMEHARERKAAGSFSDDDVTSAVMKAAAGYLQLTADEHQGA